MEPSLADQSDEVDVQSDEGPNSDKDRRLYHPDYFTFTNCITSR